LPPWRVVATGHGTKDVAGSLGDRAGSVRRPGDGGGVRRIEILPFRNRQALDVLVDDHRIHSIAQAAFFPALDRLRAGPPSREQLRIQKAAVEIDARARRILATRSGFGEEGRVPEVEIQIVGPDPLLGDAHLAHAPAAVGFEAVVPGFSELDGVFGRIDRDRVWQGWGEVSVVPPGPGSVSGVASPRTLSAPLGSWQRIPLHPCGQVIRLLMVNQRRDQPDRPIVELHLREDGSDAPSESSRFLPLRADEIRRRLVDEDSGDELAWERRLAEWARGFGHGA